MATHNFTDQELEALTDEERAGLEDEDLVDEGDNAEDEAAAEAERVAAAKAKAESDEAAKGETEKETPTRDTETITDEVDGKGEGKDDTKQEPAKAEPAELKPRPLFNVSEVPADIDDQLAAVKAAKKKLAEQFDEGEITTTDYQEKLDQLNDYQQDLREARFKASLSKEAAATQELNTWEQNCNTFLSAHPEISQSPLRYNSFDIAVRMVTGDQANANLSAQAQLAKAYENWAAEFGIKGAPAKKEPDPATKDPEKTKHKTVPNLGGLPAADASSTDDGKFAYLDRLANTSPIKFEAALQKLSESEREEYLAS